MRTIKLIHPSRGRPELANRCADSWFSRADNPKRITEILSLDKDDARKNEYGMRKSRLITIKENNGMVEAVNRGMAYIQETDIVITMYDDFTPPFHWDTIIEKLLKSHPGHAVFVDCSSNNGLQTIQIACGSLFIKWGYILYPGYYSMYSDNDYTTHAILEGIAIDAKFAVHFSHDHPLITGVGEMDETYTRSNDKKHYEQGQKLYEERKQNRFTK
jgi:glycosyltransferase involved in cell wall biosynthesis